MALAWLIAGATFAGPASAGSFSVNPVHINLPADRQAASLTITNSDAASVAVRVVALEWRQVDGVDVHTPTNNVIVSPPIFTIAPGKTQLVRIGLKNRAGASAYRVVFEEIARQLPVEGQIQITLRLDLPLYVLPKGGGKARLSWRAWRDRSGELTVEGRNSGLLHGQVVELSAVQNGERHVLSTQMGVVLPSSARFWKVGKLPELQAGAPLVLTVRSPAGETHTQLLLEQR
jgi:fimbrial chaperone protein